MTYILDKIKENNGSFVRTEASKFCVSLWYIPNGSDYHAAKSIVVFFESKETMENFHKYFSMPPEIGEDFDLSDSRYSDHFSFGKYGENGIFTEQNVC